MKKKDADKKQRKKGLFFISERGENIAPVRRGKSASKKEMVRKRGSKKKTGDKWLKGP